MKLSELKQIHNALVAMQGFKLEEVTRLKVSTAAVKIEAVLKEHQQHLTATMQQHDEAVNADKAQHIAKIAELKQQIEAEEQRYAQAVAAHVVSFQTNSAALQEAAVTVELPELSAAEFSKKGTPPELIAAMKPLLSFLKQ